MQIKINQPLARNSAAEPFDVRQLKGALNRLGYYQPFNKVGMTGMPDAALFEALIKFQSDYGLSPQGELRPDDDTVKAINQKLKQEPKDGYYIWRTVADDKVRSSHKILNGTTRKWSDSPDPTEEYNCRCWAEPVNEKDISFTDSDAFANPEDILGKQDFQKINPSVSPFDAIGGLAKGGQISTKHIIARLRDVKWIKNTPRSQLQKKFKHARSFGIRGNQNNKNLAKFQKALEDHVKSPNTTVIRGTYNKKEKVIHYYNSKTRINVMQDSTGKLRSVWRLSKKQQFHLFKDKNIGGGKK